MPARLIQVVIPDAGPLISLAKIDRLNLLLSFSSKTRLVITDYVEFEVTRNRHIHYDAQRIADFITRNPTRIEIQSTNFGQMMKQMAIMIEICKDHPEMRDKILNGKDLPSKLPADAGELSIISYINHLTDAPPGLPVLILAEDDYLLRMNAAIPGNAHVISTRSFLDALQTKNIIQNSDVLWQELEKVRPGVNGEIVDRSAQKIETTWIDTLSR